MLLNMPEEIGVDSINNFYIQLKEILSKEPEIILDFKKVKRVDLSLVQVIMAANREAKKSGKELLLKSVSADIRRQFYIAGFAK